MVFAPRHRSYVEQLARTRAALVALRVSTYMFRTSHVERDLVTVCRFAVSASFISPYQNFD